MEEFFTFAKQAFVDLKEKLNLKDSSGLKYTAQISADQDDNTPTYYLQFNGVGELLMPLTVVNKDLNKLKELVYKNLIDDLNVDIIEIAYHETAADRAREIAKEHDRFAKLNKARVSVEGKTKTKHIRKGYKNA